MTTFEDRFRIREGISEGGLTTVLPAGPAGLYPLGRSGCTT